jgi:enamine deaminase RidA (YjgF/YER057c/UK114 family)
LHFDNPKDLQKIPGFSQVGYFETPGKVIFISGQVARNEKGETIGIGNLEDQTRQVYRNISIILESLGASFKNIIKQNIYTTKLDQVATIRKVRDEFFKGSEDAMPTSTLVGGLVSPDLLIEIEAVAVLESK